MCVCKAVLSLNVRERPTRKIGEKSYKNRNAPKTVGPYSQAVKTGKFLLPFSK
jgi:hypothetical protein